jgi:hypothetical protein
MKLNNLSITSISAGTSLFFSLLLASPNASAMHITETTCTNSCVMVRNSDTGAYSIQDCCGGMVRTVFLPHTQPEAPKDP